MSKVIIIDDEPLARTVVKEYLAQHQQLELVEECNDGFEGVKAIREHQPDLIILDIQMPKINGFEMLELLDHPPAVIFATAFDEYAMKAFEANAIDYLLKPFSRERFDKAIQKWKQSEPEEQKKETRQLLDTAAVSPAQKDRVVVRNGPHIKVIPVSDILYLEAADDFVKIHTREGYFLKNRTMSHFENQLPDDSFVRSHRSYMVNIRQITRIDNHEKDNYVAVLRNGARVPVSRSGYSRLRSVLGL